MKPFHFFSFQNVSGLRPKCLYEGLLWGKASQYKDNLLFNVLKELKRQHTKLFFKSFLADTSSSNSCAIFNSLIVLLTLTQLFRCFLEWMETFLGVLTSQLFLLCISSIKCLPIVVYIQTLHYFHVSCSKHNSKTCLLTSFYLFCALVENIQDEMKFAAS